MPPVLYTAEEIADILKASVSNVYALMNQGRLPYINVGTKKGRRVRHEDLMQFLDGNRVDAPRLDVPPLKHLSLP